MPELTKEQIEAAERERCARVVDAEAKEDGYPEQLVNLAAAIRALKSPDKCREE